MRYNPQSAYALERKNLKRKLAEADTPMLEEQTPLAQITSCIQQLQAGLAESGDGIDRLALRKAAHQLADFCKEDERVEEIVKEGAVEVVVPLLSLCANAEADSNSEEMEKEACFVLGLLAVKPEFQTRIAACGALTGLVRLLKTHRMTLVTKAQPGSGGVARRAADAITNLAHENVDIKNLVRQEGGIPPLVSLLEAHDIKVQRAAAGALRTLAFKNEDNKNQIVECGALPMLIMMLRSEDVGVHYEAIGVIGNLVHSSQGIKRKVLDEGAMQPVINLLSSPCAESQREAALLLGQFATATSESDAKGKIAQRGAMPPLIRMLNQSDPQLREMAAFALGRLAQSSDNQAGIVQCGGLPPLLELLESKNHNLQHNAAFALYGVADNEDNVPDIIRESGLQRLMLCGDSLSVQASKDCVSKTVNRIEQKLSNLRVLNHVVYMLRSSDVRVQQVTAAALARLASESELKSIFVDKRGLDVLLDMLTDQSVDEASQREAAGALLVLAKKVNATSPIDVVPSQPNRTVYLGSQYVNNATLADVTFVVEGRKFYAHRIALLASSDAFRAMFDGGYREKEASSIEIPNIPWEVFEAMMRYIYTGQVEVEASIAQELLQASDQYLLEGLKRLCEVAIARSLNVERLVEVFALSDSFSAPQLGKRCVLYALEHYDDIVQASSTRSFAQTMARMLPQLRASLQEELSKCCDRADDAALALAP